MINTGKLNLMKINEGNSESINIQKIQNVRKARAIHSKINET